MNPRYTFLRFPEGKLKAVTFSYDDGVRQDKKFIEMLDKYGLKGTFNVNTLMFGDSEDSWRMSAEAVKKYIFDKGHEVAIHGANHRAPGKQRPIEVIRDVLDCRLGLEELLGVIVRGMAYPDSGIRNIQPGCADYEKIREILCDLGVAYSRTLGGDNDSFEVPTDFYAWMPTAHHNNPQVFEYIGKFNEFKEDGVYTASKTAKLFYLWGHTYEFDRNDNWDRIEKICEELSGKDDVWYATNIEIHDYVKAYESLVWSANARTVYNPTLIDVWMWNDGNIVRVGSGETVRLEDGTF